MKISLNTINRYTSIDVSVDELVSKINAQLGGVESVMDLGKRFKDAIVVRVVSCEDHPDADRLHVCLIDDGGVRDNVDRNPDGLVQVVCGAPNVQAGMFAVWLPPESTVPSTYDEAEAFILEARKLRGVMSYGMLASPKELGLGDSHEGILELNIDEPRPEDDDLAPGMYFAEAFGLDDTVIDIENKMFTHRPDCFGQLGVAREIAGIQHKAFVSPAWYLQEQSFSSDEEAVLTVTNEAGVKVPRFMAVTIKDVTIGPSPIWLQAELVRLGGKPINNVVDVTNYLMLLTGQPLHAYDYDTLRGATLGSRFAKQDESVTLLNGKTYVLDETDIVIADEVGPIGLGGVMGGGETEVSLSTSTIVLEVATFDMYSIRKTSMRHGLFTDAVTRFNKGQSPLQNDRILALAIRTIIDAAGGTMSGHVYDLVEELPPLAPIIVTPAFVNERLGLQLTGSDIKRLLENVEIDVVESDDELNVAPPFWRTDLAIAEDIVEEVGRLYGFDALPRELPMRTIRPASKNPVLELKQALRNSLLRSGANEVLTYSFIHENIMKRAEQNIEEAYRLSNALSPELQYYRLSVLPSLLDKIHANVKTGHAEFVLFEIGKGHSKIFAPDNDGLPVEKEQLAMVFTNKAPLEGAAFYRMKRFVTQLGIDTGLNDLIFQPLEDKSLSSEILAPFDFDRTASIQTLQGKVIGYVGELKSTVRKRFKLPDYTAAASIDIEAVLQAVELSALSYVPLSRYPKVAQDISLKVSNHISYAQLFEATKQVLETAELSKSSHMKLDCLGIYSPAHSSDKTVTFHIEIANFERTLTDEDVSVVLDAIAAKASSELGATRV